MNRTVKDILTILAWVLFSGIFIFASCCYETHKNDIPEISYNWNDDIKIEYTAVLKDAKCLNCATRTRSLSFMSSSFSSKELLVTNSAIDSMVINMIRERKDDINYMMNEKRKKEQEAKFKAADKLKDKGCIETKKNNRIFIACPVS